MIRAWVERHLGVPAPARTRSSRSRIGVDPRLLLRRDDRCGVQRDRGRRLGALILGVPLAGTIAAVTFLGAYVPYLGAWSAGAFSVLVALGGAGTDAAIGMTVVQLLGERTCFSRWSSRSPWARRSTSIRSPS